MLAACGSNPGGEADAADPGSPGVLLSEVSLGKVGALAKSATINLDMLILTLTSNAAPPDTVHDTISVSGNAQITVSRSLQLKPLRAWTLSARTLDVRDSTVHQGITAPFLVKPGDTVVVSLNLASRFSMYEARFNDLPDSVGSSVSGTSREAVRFKKLVMKVDGAVRADSTAPAYFGKGQVVKLIFDYITPGSHSVVLEAHGELNRYSGILYSGTGSFDVAPGADETRAVTLAWAGPTTGTGKLTVVIGKVGKVVINGTLPGTVFD